MVGQIFSDILRTSGVCFTCAASILMEMALEAGFRRDGFELAKRLRRRKVSTEADSKGLRGKL
jgi:hypothetical protein